MGEHKPPPLPGPWIEHAACRGRPPEWFYPTVGDVGHHGDPANALAVCATCPVVHPCRDYAITHIDKARAFGVWGGMTARERDAEKRRRTTERRTA